MKTKSLYQTWFENVWMVMLPITSIVLLPSIPGSTLAYSCAYLSPLFFLVRFNARYLGNVLKIMLGLTLAIALSQLALYQSGDTQVLNLRLVDETSTDLLLRKSLFTQLLYLFGGIFTALYVSENYEPSWDRWVELGVLVLVLYGFYEWIYFLAFGESGDFLSNRVFGAGEIDGSTFQTIELGGQTFARLKSLTSEPSNFALVMVPFMVYYLARQNPRMIWLIGVALALSTSTTAVLGLLVALLVGLRSLGAQIKLKHVAVVVGLTAMGAVFFRGVIEDFLTSMIVEKLSLGHESGADRFETFLAATLYWLDADVLIQIFGVGYGYVRSTEMFSTALVNTGLVGLLGLILLFCLPLMGAKGRAMRRDHPEMAPILMSILAMLMSSVPELAILINWFFLGLAFNYRRRIADERINMASISREST